VSKPIISIIIPVYNAENYLEECINSVYNQDVVNLEVICINDGSTDNSLAVLNKVKNKFNDLIIINQNNRGLAAARNCGLQVASGDYVYFLDNDDFLYPDVLKKMLEIVETKKLDICFFNVLKDGKSFYFHMKHQLIDVYTGKEMYKVNYELNHFFPPSAVWTMLFDNSFLRYNNLKFKEGLEHEDEEFTPRAYYHANRVSCLDIPIQFHRVLREGSITESTYIKFKESHIKDLILICSELYDFFKKNNCNYYCFYLKIFENYLAVAKIIINKKPQLKNYFLSKQDYQTMLNCINNWQWYVYYFFLKYSTPLFKWYINDSNSVIIKKIVNKIFKLVYFIKRSFNSKTVDL
jgi:glycosyltransferase involved in cell wall biosynthesis